MYSLTPTVHSIYISFISLIQQLSRQKNSLAEELLQTRRDVERQIEAVTRIAKEKEELTKEKAELIVQLTASERENRAQAEVRKRSREVKVVGF